VYEQDKQLELSCNAMQSGQHSHLHLHLHVSEVMSICQYAQVWFKFKFLAGLRVPHFPGSSLSSSVHALLILDPLITKVVFPLLFTLVVLVHYIIVEING
jgi:hypothetical protein